MTTAPTLPERIHGCLVGAAIGAELGLARAHRLIPAAQAPGDFAALAGRLDRADVPAPKRYHMTDAPLRPLIEVGVGAYLDRGGRATPEDYARRLRDDPGIAAPAFHLDNLHTVQELLREGLHPRLSGAGNVPHGLACASMPAVGIYHFADPDYAYLDGVELASVAQGRMGADWAGLSAAAIAAAFAPGATGPSVVDAVLKLALEHNKDVFTQINRPTLAARKRSRESFAEWWLKEGGYVSHRTEENYIAWNPPRFFLPLLHDYASEPELLLAFLVGGPAAASDCYGWNGLHAVPAIVAGAILGALHGPAIFPARWRRWAEPMAQPWTALGEIVRARADHERGQVALIESLARHRGAAPSSPLYDKAYGCLLAGAIGNAMGSPVEAWDFRDIDAKYPGGIRTIIEPWRLEAEDDNQMAALLIETYIDNGGRPFLARRFGATWRERLNRDHFFVQCMGHVCDQIRAGWDPRITGHWVQVTGSTVMCFEPIGLYHLGDPEFAAQDATAVSYMYQRGLDVVAAAALAATVAEAFRPDATVDSICAAALAACPDEPFRTFDTRPFRSPRHYMQTCLDVAARYDDVLAARAELYEKCLFYHAIDPLEVLGLSLALFKIARGDVRQAAIGGTNIGRDSDTISGRAAMLSGVLRGAANVPAEWVALFSASSLQRIQQNAASYARLIEDKKLPRLRVRQAVARAAAARAPLEATPALLSR